MFISVKKLSMLFSRSSIKNYFKTQVAFHRLIFSRVLDPFFSQTDALSFSSQSHSLYSNFPLLTNSIFIPIWLIFAFLTLYSFYGLDPNFTLSRDLLSADYYMNSPTIYYHQAHAKQKHGVIEVILIASFLTIHLNYLAFILLVDFEDKPRPTLGKQFSDKRCTKDTDSERLKRAQAKGSRVLRSNLRFFYLYYIIFTGKSVQANGQFVLNCRNVLFWVVLHPVGVAYYVWSKCLVLIKFQMF